MNHLHQSFSVRFTYDVYFTEQLFDPANPLLADFLRSRQSAGSTPKLLFVVDEGVVAHQPRLLNQIDQYIDKLHQDAITHSDSVFMQTVPGGEPAKNDPALVERLIDAVDRFGIDRHSYIVAIGGGSVLDLVGYVTAIAHRGIRHIRIPTTVLSQNDSGVGVKNGVNYRGKKNFLGTFAPPVAVFNDFQFLTSLDDRDWRSGMAEAVKVALIKDPAFFDWLETSAEALAHRDGEAMHYLVHRCADLHLQHIANAGDPFEQGSSRPLDFGHWSAHKLEQLTQFELRHGEAVAIGMALDCVYANGRGMLSGSDLNRILDLLHTLGFGLYHPALEGEAVLQGLAEFREHLGGRLTILLLDGIGRGREVNEMDANLIRRSVAFLHDWQQRADESPSDDVAAKFQPV